MSETITLKKQSESNIQTIHLKDYQVPTYFIDEIDLKFELTEEVTTVHARLHVRYNRHSHNTTKELILNGEELKLESLILDGQEVLPTKYELTSQHLILHDVPDSFDLEITTKIFPHKNTALKGLYCSRDTYCTQCEAEGFRRITYFPDHPDILSRYSTTIIADEKKYPILLSNGNLVESGKLENGRHWVKWQDPFKKPSYLFALVAGDFDVVESLFTTQAGRDVSLRIYVEKGFKDQAHHAMYSLKEAMKWDEKAYGREYDLDIYMIVAIGDFNAGAMENKGLNIFNTKYILAKPETATDSDYINILSVIGHEYFHNWSGNRVTCRDWFQLSLKEGLTIFRDQSFSEDILSPAVMRIHNVSYLREYQFPEDAGPLAHPVRPESYIEINNFYTTTVYNKGAEVLRMLQTILGKSTFRKGMDLYFARHDGQAVTIEDFIKTMEDVSGIDLAQFRLWYSQAGTPIVNVEDDYNVQQKLYTLTLNQTIPETPNQSNKLPMYIPIKIGLLDQKGNDILLDQGDNKPVAEAVLHFKNASQIFQFKNVATRPILSLLRNFSAPVKINFAYSNEDLKFLFEHDKDSFNRWEAGQKFMLRNILILIQDYQNSKGLNLSRDFIEMISSIMRYEKQDKFLLAEMLLLPSEKYIGEQMSVVDVDAIHVVREYVLTQIAEQLHLVFYDIYRQNHDEESHYEFNIQEIGKRQLKNRCLGYLMLLPQYTEVGMQQFDNAFKTNMTDAQPALTYLANIDTPLREKALNTFYQHWKEDPLVVDKWFAIQAASKLPNTLKQVKRLMRHESFDIKNPNKVYSLIGTFGQRNPFNFHNINGEGYAFLSETVQQLDKLNPQVAARMLNPLTMWKRYDKERQALMREQLAQILADKKLSKDLHELVTKSLNEVESS